jgi:Zn-dependent M16 (insulinase) family peptidase
LSSFENQALRGVSQNHNTDLLKKFQAVTKADVIKCLETYFLKLFDPNASVGVVVTAPGKWDEIADSLKQKGFEVEKRVIEVKNDEDGDESEGESSSGSEDESKQ